MNTSLFIILALVVPGILSQDPENQCKELLDVVAVVDGSDSISYKNFDILKQFLKTLVNDLNIGVGETRLGIILYSSDITITIPFNEDKDYLLYQISILEHARDGTNTALAIAEMNQMIDVYGRDGVPKVGIVITDGISKDPNATVYQASLAHQRNIDLFAVGVTEKVNLVELQGLASSDSKVFMVSKFSNLNTILRKVVLRKCPDQCKDYLEIVALVDGSDSISRDDFVKLKLALASLVEDIDVSENKTRFGLILYSSDITEVISLSHDKKYLLDQIALLPHPRDGTKTDLGLARMNQLFREEARAGVQKIGLVITDGISKDRNATQKEAYALKTDLNVNMFTVGISDNIDVTELSEIATLNRNILTIDIFDDLQHILENVVRMFCPLPTCTSALDVLTVVDGSDSISAEEFKELKDTLKNLVLDLDIGQSGARFGLILYSSNITAVITFTNNKNLILSEIDSLDQPRDGTETALAIQEMIKMFTKLGRSSFQRIGIVITDGMSKDPSQTKQIAQEAKREGINMFAVGVGNRIHQQELKDIASNNQVFISDSFLELSRSLMDVVRKACPDPNLTTSPTVIYSTDTVTPTIKISSSTTGSTSGPSTTIASTSSTASGSTTESTASPPSSLSPVISSSTTSVYTTSESSTSPSQSTTSPSQSTTSPSPSTTSLSESTTSQSQSTIIPFRVRLDPQRVRLDPQRVRLIYYTTSLSQSTESPSQSTASPSDYTTSPSQSIVSQSQSTTSPPQSTTSPSQSTASLSQSTSPSQSTSSLSQSTSSLSQSTTSPSQSTTSPSQSTTTLSQSTSPSQSTSSLSQSTTSPLQSTTSPSQSTMSLSQSTSSLSQSTTSTLQSTTSPSQSTTSLSQSTTSRPGSTTLNIIRISATPSFPSYVCDGCLYKNGVYLKDHPTDCNKFLQCNQKYDGSYDVIVKDCPQGLFWDQDLLLCNYPENTNCTKDPCYTLADFSTYSDIENNCRQYFKCVNGISYLECCESGYGFDKVTRMCSPSTTCTEACPSAYVMDVCDKRAVVGNALVFEQKIPSFGWIRMNCALGTAFNETACYCSSFVDVGYLIPVSSGPTPSNVCTPELYLPFDNNTRDQSGNGFYVQNNGVVVEDGVAYFDGNSSLRIPRFTNVDFGTKLRITFKYKVDGIRSTPQALVTNSDCGEEGSLYIVSDPDQVTFSTRTDNLNSPLPALTTLSSSEWNEVEFKYDNGVFTGTVNGASNTQIIMGSIKRNHYALQIGRGDQFSNFKGWIDEVYVYMC
ncbi:hypothetical protein LOTGIDRAFT_236719 [Lottia gigantea]|uniref:Chitinase n=1 Tax=Lottia gigantea TaxID=225164 RepID=V3ZGI3_LOTGI|nr:hypothetical protein LOTGIDRAFT_236719 [Lottia gigantea]ESO83272.1 hypothetical protein LOTGIDRAFT_236719 [Lottia gigantea]